jgi:hypothetical protein
LKKVPVIDDHGFILRERYVELSAWEFLQLNCWISKVV